MAQAPTARLHAVRSAMDRTGVDALLVTNPQNVAYLSGFNGGDSALIISARSQYILTDFRYVEQAESDCPTFKLVQQTKGLLTAAASKANQLHAKRLGFEASSLSVAQHQQLRRRLKATRLKRTADLVEGLRLVKDPGELVPIRQAIAAAEAAYQATLRHVKPGLSERSIAAELAYQMKRRGADKEAFDLIVAWQERASLPHAVPTDRTLRRGQLALFDWGAQVGGYHSDITRVAFAGRIPRKLRAIYDIVLEAQLAALSKVGPGAVASEVDGAARAIITRAGYGPMFGHSTGHGVGLDIHELPRISAKSQTMLKQGMVFTVEPGIYIPEVGGVRIEDMVLVTPDGAQILTSLPKRIEDCVLR